MVKTELIRNSTEVFKKQTFPLLFQLKMQQTGESGFSINFLDFLNELLNSNLTGKLLKQHLALIVLFAGTEQNYLTPERDIKIPDKGEHKSQLSFHRQDPS